MAKVARRHHYVSQFFLKNFSKDGESLYIYDKSKNEYRYQVTRKIASENNFYTYLVKGKEENLENVFGAIEGTAKPVLDKVIRGEEISMQDKAELSMFLATLRVRIPNFKKQTEEGAEKVYKKMNKFTFANRDYVKNLAKKAGKELTEKELEELIEFATDDSKYYVKFPPNFWLASMLKLSLEIANIFIDSNWEVYHFDKKYALLTSDNPVVLVPPKEYHPFYGYGLATQGTIKAIALSSDTCVLMRELTRTPIILHANSRDKEIFRWVNRITAMNSDRFIFSPEQGKLEKLVKDLKLAGRK